MAVIKIAIIIDEEKGSLDFKVAKDDKVVPVNLAGFKALVENLIAGITPVEARNNEK